MTTDHGRIGRIEAVLILALLASVLAASLYHLRTYPAPWFDEGWWLQAPRNLVLYGKYATLSAEGFQFDNTSLGAAPTMSLPIALAFKLAGIGFLQARLVMVMYLLATAAVFYVVARSAYGPTVAVAALYLFLFKVEDDPFTSTLYLGRQVMAELPGLVFLLLGCLLFFKARDGKRKISLVLSGVFFGLAIVTKLQFAIWILPAILGTAILAHLRGERLWTQAILTVVIAVGCLLLWYACLWLVLGPANFAAMVQVMGIASSRHVSVFSFASLGTALKFLLRSDFLRFGVPGLVYAFYLYIRRDHVSVPPLLLMAAVVVGMAWYVLGSIGWPRYAYPLLAISYIFTAKLLIDLADGFREPVHGRLSLRPKGVAVLLILLILPWAPFREIAKGILAPPDDSLQEFNRAIQASVPRDAVIETWEWEVALLDQDHRYHFPPVPLLSELIAHVNLGVPYDPQQYDFLQAEPEYFVTGRFANDTGVYPEEFLDNQCRLVVTVGDYRLFEVIAK